MLAKKSLLLGCDNILLILLLGLLLSSLLPFLLSLGTIDRKLLLPQLLDVALVLQFAHSSFLRVHLLKTLVLGELLGHLDLEILFHAALLRLPLGLELKLIVLGSLQLMQLTKALVLSFTLGLACALFSLLDLQVIAQVFDVLLLGTSLGFLKSELLEDSLTLGLSLILESLKVICTLLLLASITAHQLLFVLIELLLSLDQGLLLIEGENHILLALLLLNLVDSDHFVVLVNHLVNDGVDLLTLLDILLVSHIS